MVFCRPARRALNSISSTSARLCSPSARFKYCTCEGALYCARPLHVESREQRARKRQRQAGKKAGPAGPRPLGEKNIAKSVRYSTWPVRFRHGLPLTGPSTSTNAVDARMFPRRVTFSVDPRRVRQIGEIGARGKDAIGVSRPLDWMLSLRTSCERVGARSPGPDRGDERATGGF